MLSRKLIAVVVLLAAALSATAHATTVVVKDSAWHQFDVDDTVPPGGLGWIDLDIPAAPLHFSFTSATALLLTVVDAGFGGDRFQVFDNGASLGLTSIAANTYPGSSVLDFDAALADPSYSFATFILSAGTHDITGLLALSALDDEGMPINATIGALRVVAASEPESMLLLLLGGGALILFGRRRRINAHPAA